MATLWGGSPRRERVDHGAVVDDLDSDAAGDDGGGAGVDVDGEAGGAAVVGAVDDVDHDVDAAVADVVEGAAAQHAQLAHLTGEGRGADGAARGAHGLAHVGLDEDDVVAVLATHKVCAAPSSSKTHPPSATAARARGRTWRKSRAWEGESSAGLRHGDEADSVETCLS